MKLKHLFLSAFLSFITISFCVAQEEILYKKVDSTDLFLEVYYPEQVEAGKSQAAMVFFFGGGWVGGDKVQFLNHAKYLS
ncbi:MAG: hypothetical protein P8O16_03990 [Algoriphagus sp.]|uniref:hypothetical protein n=1 Tax=Algoriphagus sp. TaxID=1872435 RepID=UPI00261F4E84|nr:hypothetical protein [Algoriphagus sp.]MDG1276416.1 hypothetical protein [Algoriphagus sp.]